MSKKLKTVIAVIIAITVIAGSIAAAVYITKSKSNVKLSGILEANTYEVPSLSQGPVNKVLVKEAEPVKAGDVVMQLDTTQLEIRKKQAEAAVKLAESELDLLQSGASDAQVSQIRAKVGQALGNYKTIAAGARPEEIKQAEVKLKTAKSNYETALEKFESMKKLADQDIIPKAKFDEAKVVLENAQAQKIAAEQALKLLKKGAPQGQKEAAQQQVSEAKSALTQVIASKPAKIKAAKANIEQAKAELSLVEQMIKDSAIKTKVKGNITNISFKEGEVVTKGTSVANIIDLENLWVKVFVPESKLVYIRLGQPATIYPEATPKMEFAGKITFIAQEGEFVPSGVKESKDQQVFEVKVALDSSVQSNVQLRPGMTVDVKMDTTE